MSKAFPPPLQVFIGIGSNLNNPLEQVTTAIAAIDHILETRVIAHSPWYRSTPLGPQDQPDYINGVIELTTTLTADRLLSELQSIEKHQGRIPDERWGARPLDLDILLYGSSIIDTTHLQVPHPQLAARNFVLFPLADLAPDLTLPDGTKLNMLLANVSAQGIVRLSKEE